MGSFSLDCERPLTSGRSTGPTQLLAQSEMDPPVTMNMDPDVKDLVSKDPERSEVKGGTSGVSVKVRTRT